MKQEPTDIERDGLALIAWNQRKAEQRARPVKGRPEPEPEGKAWGGKSQSEKRNRV